VYTKEPFTLSKITPRQKTRGLEIKGRQEPGSHRGQDSRKFSLEKPPQRKGGGGMHVKEITVQHQHLGGEGGRRTKSRYENVKGKDKCKGQ